MGGQEACGQVEDLFEALHGSKGDDVGGMEYALLVGGESGFLPLLGVMGEDGLTRDGLGMTFGEAG